MHKKRRSTEPDTIAFAACDSKEWHVAWKAMADLTGDDDFTALDPESGEAWQYMGSVERTGQWEHSFRHRWHPRLRRRLVIFVPASATWKPRPPEFLSSSGGAGSVQ